MATLLFTAVGTMLGGPIGGAIGAALGGAVDRSVLFASAGREGPRLSELAVQTSSYGTQIPRLFGTMRVAGSVIWATDLVEHRDRTRTGKGQPSVTTYSYTASFAVALSARPLGRVRRIWAEGKLLRGAEGDFKSGLGAFRFYGGGEDQAADSLIQSVEGAARAPAHRGLAYVVFEDLELADFGNRIPALTFEVEADADAPDAGAIAQILAPEVDARDALGPLLGFAAQGDNVRAVVETLLGAGNGWCAQEENRIALLRGPGIATTVEDSAARAEGDGAGRGERAIAARDHAPRTLSLSYYDVDRDYQTGVQRATRPGAGVREERSELPAVTDAARAKAIAVEALVRMDLERERRTLRLGWDAIPVGPGARVRIAGTAGLWRVDRWTLEAMVVRVECVRVASAALVGAASPGRATPAADTVSGDTILAAFELPLLDDGLATAPRLALAAAGTATGWRGAALMLRDALGDGWTAIGGTASPAVIGTLVDPPGAGPVRVVDRVNSLTVVFPHDAMQLQDADLAALRSGGNCAWVGGELLQFASAEPLGSNRWRLRDLWRGRRGTEAFVGTQGAGDGFVLLSSETIQIQELAMDRIGTVVPVLAQGPGDAEAVVAQTMLSGISVLPPSPVGLRWTETETGTRVQWTRRSRNGWRWVDGVDAPLGEEREAYRVTIAPSLAPERVEETSVAHVMLLPTDRAGPCVVTVRQIGTHGLSPPLTAVVPLLSAA